jgi:hypothetical protein
MVWPPVINLSDAEDGVIAVSDGDAPDVFVESGSIAWSSPQPLLRMPPDAPWRSRTIVILAVLVVAQAGVIGWQWQFGSRRAPDAVALARPAVPATVPASTPSVAPPSKPEEVARPPVSTLRTAPLTPALTPRLLVRAPVNPVNGATTSRPAESARVAGQVAASSLALPDGLLNINAAPWAEVSVDGRALGTTPLGNIRLPLGNHDVTFHHPQLGDRTVRVLVTATGAARVSIDLRQP